MATDIDTTDQLLFAELQHHESHQSFRSNKDNQARFEEQEQMQLVKQYEDEGDQVNSEVVRYYEFQAQQLTNCLFVDHQKDPMNVEKRITELIDRLSSERERREYFEREVCVLQKKMSDIVSIYVCDTDSNGKPASLFSLKKEVVDLRSDVKAKELLITSLTEKLHVSEEKIAVLLNAETKAELAQRRSASTIDKLEAVNKDLQRFLSASNVDALKLRNQLAASASAHSLLEEKYHFHTQRAHILQSINTMASSSKRSINNHHQMSIQRSLEVSLKAMPTMLFKKHDFEEEDDDEQSSLEQATMHALEEAEEHQIKREPLKTDELQSDGIPSSRKSSNSNQQSGSRIVSGVSGFSQQKLQSQPQSTSLSASMVTDCLESQLAGFSENKEYLNEQLQEILRESQNGNNRTAAALTRKIEEQLDCFFSELSSQAYELSLLRNRIDEYDRKIIECSENAEQEIETHVKKHSKAIAALKKQTQCEKKEIIDKFESQVAEMYAQIAEEAKRVYSDEIADLQLELEKAALNHRHLASELKLSKKEIAHLKKARLQEINNHAIKFVEGEQYLHSHEQPCEESQVIESYSANRIVNESASRHTHETNHQDNYSSSSNLQSHRSSHNQLLQHSSSRNQYISVSERMPDASDMNTRTTGSSSSKKIPLSQSNQSEKHWQQSQQQQQMHKEDLSKASRVSNENQVNNFTFTQSMQSKDAASNAHSLKGSKINQSYALSEKLEISKEVYDEHRMQPPTKRTFALHQ